MTKVKLGDVAIERKQTHKGNKDNIPNVGLEHLTPSEVRLSRWDMNVDNTFTKGFTKGQILLGRRRVYLKKAVVAPFDGICSGDITVIEAIPNKIREDLLPFVIQNDRFFDYATKGSAGSLSPRVKWEYLKEYEFDLPSIKEQERLAKLLWAAYELKESYKKLIVATDEMVKAQFIEMFGNTDSINKISKLEDIVKVCDHLRKPLNDASRKNMKEGKLYPYYGANGLVDYINQYRINFSALCIVEDCGSYESGSTSSYIIREKCWVNNHAHIVVPDENICMIEYLHYYLKYSDLTKYVAGTTRSKLTRAAMNKIEIVVPSINLQRIFVSIVQQADQSKAELQQSIEKIDSVIKSLLP